MTEWTPPRGSNTIIVCAACKYGDLIVTGARHWDDIMHNVVGRAYGRSAKEVKTHSKQGFIDQWGRFYTREQAYKIVQENGQPFNAERNGPSTTELFSEGLY